MLEDAGGAAAAPMAQLSETDQFMIMLNVCAAVCGSFVYCMLRLRQRQVASQRERYFPGPFVSLAEASQAWKVYRPCGSKSDRDSHVCNFCGFAIKALPAELATETPPGGIQETVDEQGKNDSKGLRRRQSG